MSSSEQQSQQAEKHQISEHPARQASPNQTVNGTVNIVHLPLEERENMPNSEERKFESNFSPIRPREMINARKRVQLQVRSECCAQHIKDRSPNKPKYYTEENEAVHYFRGMKAI